MTRVRARGEEIRRYLLTNVQANPIGISKLAMARFGVSRQAINRHLTHLVEGGALTESGQTRGREYRLAQTSQWKKDYPIHGGLAEDIVWRDDIDEVIGKLPENVRDIWFIAFTEMFNNARDHSGGTTIRVSITKTAVNIEMAIMDNGVGIFRKIQKAMNLLDERHAILELSKGKLTTDSSRHSGQGIFFTSRMLDAFEILSGGLFFSHTIDSDDDWLLERTAASDGTAVFMRLDSHTARTALKVYDAFTSGEPGDMGFTKTVVPVRLAQYGEDKLVSRSQAKRVMARVEQFKTVVLSFEDVDTIGQAFADEIFRVYVLAHPDVSVVATSTKPEVRKMIKRAQLGTGSPEITALSPEAEAELEAWPESTSQ
jgi:biotin operon repressor